VDLPPSPSDYALSHAYLTASHAESLGRPSVALLVIEPRRLLAGGLSNSAIATRLGLSSKTVNKALGSDCAQSAAGGPGDNDRQDRSGDALTLPWQRRPRDRQATREPTNNWQETDDRS
jgi:hypothetical protein